MRKMRHDSQFNNCFPFCIILHGCMIIFFSPNLPVSNRQLVIPLLNRNGSPFRPSSELLALVSQPTSEKNSTLIINIGNININIKIGRRKCMNSWNELGRIWGRPLVVTENSEVVNNKGNE